MNYDKYSFNKMPREIKLSLTQQRNYIFSCRSYQLSHITICSKQIINEAKQNRKIECRISNQINFSEISSKIYSAGRRLDQLKAE